MKWLKGFFNEYYRVLPDPHRLYVYIALLRYRLLYWVQSTAEGHRIAANKGLMGTMHSYETRAREMNCKATRGCTVYFMRGQRSAIFDTKDPVATCSHHSSSHPSMTLSLSQLYHDLAVTHRLLGDDTRLALEENTFNKLAFSGAYKLTIESGPVQPAPHNGIYIYHGALSCQPDTTDMLSNMDDKEVPVVIKVATTENSFQQLVDEGRFYAKHLVDAVSKHLVAICLGAYRVANAMADGKAIGCLLLEDCGPSVKTFDWEESSSRDIVRFNISLIETVMDIHRTGVSHGEIAPQHVTVFEENPYIVGFSAGRATSNYQCSCQGKGAEDVWSLRVAPNKGPFGCDELHDLCQALAIWGSTTFTCYGLPVFMDDLNSPEDIELVANAKYWYIEYDEALKMVYEAADKYLTEVAPKSDYARTIKAVMEDGFEEYCMEYKDRKEAEPEDATLY